MIAALLSILLLQSAKPAAQQPADHAVATQAAQKPLPNIEDLLNDVERNEAAAEALRNDYTYHVHFQMDDFDSSGRIKKTVVTDSESTAIDGVRIDRVVARNGKPLTADEQKKEDGRIDKEIARDRARRARLQSKGELATGNGEAMLTVSRFLALGAFSNPRRMMLNGRPTIVLDYAGDPHAKTKDETEGMVRDLVGTAWIDEADRVLVQAEGRFLKDFKVGGGLLVDIHGGLSFSYREQKINDEVWLPAEIDGQGSARILLFVKMNGRVKLQTSDYRKFRTGATIVPGYQVIGPDGKPVPAPQPSGAEKTPSTSPPETGKGQPKPPFPQS